MCFLREKRPRWWLSTNFIICARYIWLLFSIAGGEVQWRNLLAFLHTLLTYTAPLSHVGVYKVDYVLVTNIRGFVGEYTFSLYI